MSADLPKWLTFGDPSRICERVEEMERQAAKHKPKTSVRDIHELFAEVKLTEDESIQIENLLMTWYEYEDRYRVALGAPRVCPSCRGHDSGEVHDDGDDRDAKINQIEAEAVAACIDELHYLQRAAISLHMRNRTGPSVWRNKRIGSIEEAHAKYQEAKLALLPRLKRRGLMK